MPMCRLSHTPAPLFPRRSSAALSLKRRRCGSIWIISFFSRPSPAPARLCLPLSGMRLRLLCVPKVMMCSTTLHCSPSRKCTLSPHALRRSSLCAVVCATSFVIFPFPSSLFTPTTNFTATCSPCTASSIFHGLIHHPFSNITL